MTKKTIFQVLKEKLGEKPATRQEIEQLKLDLERANLKASIAVAKRKAKGTRPNLSSKLVPEKTHVPESYRMFAEKRARKAKYNPPIERRDSSSEVEKVFGSNKSKDYRSITG